MFKRIGVLFLAVIIWSLCLELGEQLAIPGLPGFVSPGGRRRPPVDAGELRRRRATDRAPLCRRGLLLGACSQPASPAEEDGAVAGARRERPARLLGRLLAVLNIGGALRRRRDQVMALIWIVPLVR